MDVVQMVLHFDQYLGAAIAHYGTAVYLLLFMIVFCEIGIAPLFFLPGDPLVFICGAFCASGALNLWILMPVLFVATVAGSCLGYTVGRMLGHQVFNREYRWLHKDSLHRSSRFYERYGSVLLLFSAFIAVIRTFAPLLAGVFALSAARFLQFAVIGALLWVGTLGVGGYLFGNIPVIREHLNAIVLLGVGLGVGTLVASALLRILQKRRRYRVDLRR